MLKVLQSSILRRIGEFMSDLDQIEPKVGKRYRITESFMEGHEGECIKVEKTGFGHFSAELKINTEPYKNITIRKRATDIELVE